MEQATAETSTARSSVASEDPSICYVAEGKLYLKRPGADAATLIESTFAQELIDRAQRGRDRNGWRQQGMMWNFGSGGRGILPPGMPDGPPAEVRRVRFTGISPGGAGAAEIYYALDTDHVGGLFQYDLREGYERRLYHAHEFRAHHLSRHPTSGQLAMSVREPDGTAHVALADANGRKLRKVTEGDVVDECPSWIVGENALVYQSAGVGRSEQGFRMGLGPYVVHRLDLDDGSMRTLAEDESYDFLLPRVDERDGALWFIRRPYQPHGPPVSPWKVFLDVVLFPYRLVRAIVHFLDFFSRVFSRQPLMTAGGPPREGPDQRTLMLWGKVIDAEKEMAKSHRDGDGSLVPDSWQLVRRAKDGSDAVVARGVVAYDLCPGDGSVVYTNGNSVVRIGANGSSDPIVRGRLIESVRVLPTTPAR